MIGDMVEDLQQHLFTWTKEHGDGISQWKESVLSGKKYQTTPGDLSKRGMRQNKLANCSIIQICPSR